MKKANKKLAAVFTLIIAGSIFYVTSPAKAEEKAKADLMITLGYYFGDYGHHYRPGPHVPPPPPPPPPPHHHGGPHGPGYMPPPPHHGGPQGPGHMPPHH